MYQLGEDDLELPGLTGGDSSSALVDLGSLHLGGGSLDWAEQQPAAIPDPMLGLYDDEEDPSGRRQQQQQQQWGDRTVEQQAEQASSQLRFLRLSASAGGGELDTGEAPAPPGPDPAVMEADPLAALECAIEADHPRFKPSPGWQKMLEAVEQELSEAGPTLLPDVASIEAYDMPVGSLRGGAEAQQQQQAAAQSSPEDATTEPMEQSTPLVAAESQLTTEVLSSGDGGGEGEVASCSRMQA